MLSVEPLLHRRKRCGAVVIGHRQVAQAKLLRLLNQRKGLEASITALGVAVKVERSGATLWPHASQNRN